MTSEAEPNPPGGLETTAGPEMSSPSAPEPVPPGNPPTPLAAAPEGTAIAAPSHGPSMVFLAVVTGISLAADLVTKWWAKSTLSGWDAKLKGVKKFPVLKDHFDFIFAQNPGGAWSFLRGLPDSLRRPFFLTVSACAIVFIVSIYRRIHPNQRAMKWGLPLALGGAMGNLVDRIRYGWVVDFMDAYIVRGGREHHWPTFNVADIAIVVGVGLMAIDMISTRGQQRQKPEIKPEPAPAAPPVS